MQLISQARLIQLRAERDAAIAHDRQQRVDAVLAREHRDAEVREVAREIAEHHLPYRLIERIALAARSPLDFEKFVVPDFPGRDQLLLDRLGATWHLEDKADRKAFIAGVVDVLSQIDD